MRVVHHDQQRLFVGNCQHRFRQRPRRRAGGCGASQLRQRAWRGCRDAARVEQATARDAQNAAPRIRLIGFHRPHGGHHRAIEARAPGELVRQPALSRTAVALDQHDTATASLPAAVPRAHEPVELGAPPHQWCATRFGAGRLQAQRPVVTNAGRQRLGLGVRRLTVLLEPLGECGDRRQCAPPIAGQGERAQQRPDGDGGSRIELLGGPRRLLRRLQVAARQRLAGLGHEYLDRAPLPVRPLRRHPVVEFRGAVDAQPVEKGTGDQPGRRLVVAARCQRLHLLHIQRYAGVRQPHVRAGRVHRAGRELPQRRHRMRE